jgi:hypothetical protein
MQNSDRILTTHTGSLPRPPEVLAPGGATDEAVLADAVNDVVRRQVAAGMDFVSDGEMSKPSYVGYVADVLTGFGGTSESTPPPDVVDFPWGACLRRRRAFLKTLSASATRSAGTGRTPSGTRLAAGRDRRFRRLRDTVHDCGL